TVDQNPLQISSTDYIALASVSTPDNPQRQEPVEQPQPPEKGLP
ncbi:unnamed protein product, partial [Didymodactylos carnosus]